MAPTAPVVPTPNTAPDLEAEYQEKVNECIREAEAQAVADGVATEQVLAYNLGNARSQYADRVATMQDSTIGNGDYKVLGYLGLVQSGDDPFAYVKYDYEVARDATLAHEVRARGIENDVQLTRQLALARLLGARVPDATPANTQQVADAEALNEESELELLAKEVAKFRLEHAGVTVEADGTINDETMGRLNKLARKWAQWSEEGKSGLLKKIATGAVVGVTASAFATVVLGAAIGTGAAVAAGVAATRVSKVIGTTKLAQRGDVFNAIDQADATVQRVRARYGLVTAAPTPTGRLANLLRPKYNDELVARDSVIEANSVADAVHEVAAIQHTRNQVRLGVAVGATALGIAGGAHLLEGAQHLFGGGSSEDATDTMAIDSKGTSATMATSHPASTTHPATTGSPVRPTATHAEASTSAATTHPETASPATHATATHPAASSTASHEASATTSPTPSTTETSPAATPSASSSPESTSSASPSAGSTPEGTTGTGTGANTDTTTGTGANTDPATGGTGSGAEAGTGADKDATVYEFAKHSHKAFVEQQYREGLGKMDIHGEHNVMTVMQADAKAAQHAGVLRVHHTDDKNVFWYEVKDSKGHWTSKTSSVMKVMSQHAVDPHKAIAAAKEAAANKHTGGHLDLVREATPKPAVAEAAANIRQGTENLVNPDFKELADSYQGPTVPTGATLSEITANADAALGQFQHAMDLAKDADTVKVGTNGHIQIEVAKDKWLPVNADNNAAIIKYLHHLEELERLEAKKAS